jgi:hypothetical protein
MVGFYGETSLNTIMKQIRFGHSGVLADWVRKHYVTDFGANYIDLYDGFDFGLSFKIDRKRFNSYYKTLIGYYEQC